MALHDALPWADGSDETDVDGADGPDETDTDATMSQDDSTSPQGETPPGADQAATLEPRLNDLETELDGATDRMRRMEETQQQLSERVEELDDTVRQLLGVYDRLAADANPFVADDTDDGGPFGVADTHDSEDPDPPASDAAASEPPTPEDAEDVVTYEDLAGDADDDSPTPEEAEDAAAASEPPTPEDGPAAVPEPTPVEDAPVSTYAGEIVALEWLSSLVNRGGPAHALRALGHYEDVGWIDAETRAYLERVLSGPELDIHVDPEAPGDLTSEDHERSRRYIAQLEETERRDL